MKNDAFPLSENPVSTAFPDYDFGEVAPAWFIAGARSGLKKLSIPAPAAMPWPSFAGRIKNPRRPVDIKNNRAPFVNDKIQP